MAEEEVLNGIIYPSTSRYLLLSLQFSIQWAEKALQSKGCVYVPDFIASYIFAEYEI
jgi:hypothetical protein